MLELELPVDLVQLVTAPEPSQLVVWGVLGVVEVVLAGDEGVVVVVLAGVEGVVALGDDGVVGDAAGHLYSDMEGKETAFSLHKSVSIAGVAMSPSAIHELQRCGAAAWFVDHGGTFGLAVDQRYGL